MAETILVVDDEKREAEMLAFFLKGKGFTVFTADSGAAALVAAEQRCPEVVVMDIKMPGMNGLECLPRMKQLYPATEVIMVTAVGETETVIECMKAGAFGYLMKPVDLQALYTELMKALEHRALILKVNDYQKNLELKVEERTGEIQALNQRLKGNFLTSIRMLISLLEIYDPYIGAHLRRVAQLCGEIGRDMKMPPKEVAAVELAALLHDIGTVALPVRLRTASFAELTPEEIMVVRQHPAFAQNIMENAEELAQPAQIVRSHLERLDGSGFPDGLKDEQIPFGARILAVANAYDELVYRRRFTNELIDTDFDKNAFAIGQIERLGGKSYDLAVIRVLKVAVERLRLKALNAVVVGLEKLKPGMVLAEDVKTAEGLLLLARGNQVTATQIGQMRRFWDMQLINGNFLVQT